MSQEQEKLEQMTAQERYDQVRRERCKWCGKGEPLRTHYKEHRIYQGTIDDYPCTAPTPLEWAGELAEALARAEQERDEAQAQLKATEDSLSISRTQTKDAFERVGVLHNAIVEHRNLKSDDRCWLADNALYHAAGLEQTDTTLPSKEEFLQNCARYWRCQQGPSGVHWPSYQQIERERDEARAQAMREALVEAQRAYSLEPTLPVDNLIASALSSDAGREWLADKQRLQERVAELETALEPFEKYAHLMYADKDEERMDRSFHSGSSPTLGDCRRAAAVLARGRK